MTKGEAAPPSGRRLLTVSDFATGWPPWPFLSAGSAYLCRSLQTSSEFCLQSALPGPEGMRWLPLFPDLGNTRSAEQGF